ncbi:MAG: hypothetical protein J3K34DRAFT_111942 [Monoraphidium minutum]|nr:MAG: hypothetical protein J3K34DRAFT_111942 [Monoraphidium minutum]
MSACMKASAQSLAQRRGSSAGRIGGAFAARPAAPARRGRIGASGGADASPERPVFKITSRGPEMSLDDIRDAFEVCSLIPAANERSQCYSCWGIDAERMTSYYEAVLGLEAALTGGAGAAAARRYADPDEFQSANASMAE